MRCRRALPAQIPIGYPDVNFGPTTRKPLDEILRWNKW
jgi:nitroreductase